MMGGRRAESRVTSQIWKKQSGKYTDEVTKLRGSTQMNRNGLICVIRAS